jgi:threonine dehydratase
VPDIDNTLSASSIAERADQVVTAHERIRPAIVKTPLEPISGLVTDTPVQLFFKREDLQHTGSFKIRGATNKILSLTPAQAAAGVIAASNGNHGLGVAEAARRAGISAEVYVSSQVSPGKAQRIEQMGATIRRAGSDPLAAELAARKAADESGKVFISPYNDLEVIAGQGTIGLEIRDQNDSIDAVYIAVGGGGLISGIGAYLKKFSPETEIVACWPENSPVMYECMNAGRIVDVPEKPTVSESTAGGLEPESVTLKICEATIDASVQVSEEEIVSAMKRVRDLQGWVMEGAAGVALAAFLKEAARYEGKNVAIVICGGNVSQEVLQRMHT